MPAFQFLGNEGEGRLDAALALPGHDYYHSDAHATACMFWALVQDHPFRDGNKRYAIVATNVFLMLNGCICLISNEEWEVLALSVARRDTAVEEITVFFESRTRKVENIDDDWVMAMAHEVSKEAIHEVTKVAESLGARAKKLVERISN